MRDLQRVSDTVQVYAMITKAQYQMLTSLPFSVKVEWGKANWPDGFTESGIAKLVQMKAVVSRITGELGNYTVLFEPTTKADDLKREYEAGSKAERKERGLR
jgi:hypothetical protein